MKRILLSIISLLFFANINAQPPQSFMYQGIAHNFDGSPVANKQITVEATILQGTDCNTNCNIVWQELHFPVTNELGVFTVEIGEGQSTFTGNVDSFPQINWSDRTAGDYYLRIRVDFGTSDYGNSMLDLGTSKILSVPYAMVSQAAQTLEKNQGKVDLNLVDLNDVDTAGLGSNDILVWDGSKWITALKPVSGVDRLIDLTDVSVTSPADLQALMYSSANSAWINTSLLLNTITDVSISAPANAQTITYNSTTSRWENNYLTMPALGDVSLSALTSNSILFYDGSNWINKDAVWLPSTSNITLNPNIEDLPIILRKKASIGNAIYIDSLGKKDFVLQGTNSYSSAVNIYDDFNLVFYGDYMSLLIGRDNINPTNPAFSSYTFIMGNSNYLNGSAKSMVIGENNKVGDINTASLLVVGDNNFGDGFNSYNVVFGNSNTLSQKFNMILGSDNQLYNFTSGDSLFSFIVGNSNYNSGVYGVVIGHHLRNETYATITIGQYNDYSATTSATSWSSSDPVFVVGNGTSDAARSNSVVITKDGDIYIAGNIFTGQSPIAAKNSKFISTSALDITKNIKINNINGDFYLDPISLKSYFPDDVKKFGDNYAISTQNLVPVLIKTIQEQQEIIDNQNKKIDELEARLEKLEQALYTLPQKK